MTIDGKEVLTIRPDFAQRPMVLNAARAWSRVGVAQAPHVGFFTGSRPIHTLDHDYTLRGQTIRDFEDFFNARCGKWQDFLLPSWICEFGNGETNSQDSLSGTADLYFDWCDFATAFDCTSSDTSKPGHYFFVLWPDGQFFAERATAMAGSVADDYDAVTLDSNLPRDVVPGDGSIIGLCYSVRFGSDELEMEFRGPSIALASMTFIEHVNSTPEADV